MAFMESLNTGKAVEPFVVVPATANEVFKPGEAISISSGKATKCAATATPAYICQSNKTAGASDTILCTIVNAEQELEVPLSAAGTSLAIGNKVTIGSDGLTVTATTASGVFYITKINGTAVGDTVCGYFLW